MSSLTSLTPPKSPTQLATSIVASIYGHGFPRDIDDGAIAIRFIERNPAIHSWLFEENASKEARRLDASRDFILTANPAVQLKQLDDLAWRDSPMNHHSKLEASALSRLEGCVYAAANNFGRSSKDLPTKSVTENRSNAPGALCYDVIAVDHSLLTPARLSDTNQSHLLLLRICVSVASGTTKDESYAMESYDAIMGWLRPASDYLVIVPGIPRRHVIP